MLNNGAPEESKHNDSFVLSDNPAIFGVELHIHLFGAVAPQIIYAAAQRKKCLPADVKSLQDFLPKVTAPAQCQDLLDFLRIFWYSLPIIAGDRVALKELALDFCKQQYNSGILYSEARFTPWEVLGKANTAFVLSYDEVMQIILSGFEEGCAKYGIQIRSILSVLCEWDGDKDKRCSTTLQLMDKYRYDSNTRPCGVVGIDIAGNEADRVAKNIVFDETFQTAKQMGFHCTVHAGEAAGAQSVKYAIEHMCAERIGHGYRSVEDAEVLNLAKAQNRFDIEKLKGAASVDLPMVHFECCPTSSVCTNAVKDYKRSDEKWHKHPMKEFVKHKVHFGINTDDPMVFQTDRWEEIKVCREKLEMSWKDIGACDVRSAEAAFIDDIKQKEKLIGLVTERVQAWVRKQEMTEQ